MYGDALTTIARVKDRLQITATTFDDFLTATILAVTARIEQMCNRRFIQATYTNEIHDGSDIYGARRTILIPRNAPVQVVSSVQYKTGLNSDPTWYSYTQDDYDLDPDTGLLYFRAPLPQGKRNIRITYTAGFSGYDIGVSNFWFFNVVPTGTVNGSNGTFTLPEDATQVIVYADGVRLASANVTFVVGTATFTIGASFVPFSTIAVDYLRENAYDDSDLSLPLDLVEVAEKAVVRTFKKRDSEGRLNETFGESSVSWDKDVFTPEDLRTIRNYRRGYHL
jgi:hypothetical protein